MKRFNTRAEEQAFIEGKVGLYDNLRRWSLWGSCAVAGADVIVFATRNPVAGGALAAAVVVGLGVHAATNSLHEGYVHHEYDTDADRISGQAPASPPEQLLPPAPEPLPKSMDQRR